jgi:hypothetical protein
MTKATNEYWRAGGPENRSKKVNYQFRISLIRKILINERDQRSALLHTAPLK